MTILIDSSFLYAVKIKGDKNHRMAKKILLNLEWKKYGMILTNDLVVNESFTLTHLRTKGNLQAINAMSEFVWGKERFFTIYQIQIENYPKIVDVMVKFSNVSKNELLSFVDASLIFLAKEQTIQDIVSFDHHFDGILTRIFEI